MPETKQDQLGEAFDKVADVTREVLESQLRFGTDVVELAQSVWKKGSDPLEAGRSYLTAYWREARNYWGAAGDLYLQYTTDLLKLGNRAVETVLADVSSALDRPAAEGKTADATTTSARPKTTRSSQRTRQ